MLLLSKQTHTQNTHTKTQEHATLIWGRHPHVGGRRPTALTIDPETIHSMESGFGFTAAAAALAGAPAPAPAPAPAELEAVTETVAPPAPPLAGVSAGGGLLLAPAESAVDWAELERRGIASVDGWGRCPPALLARTPQHVVVNRASKGARSLRHWNLSWSAFLGLVLVLLLSTCSLMTTPSAH